MKQLLEYQTWITDNVGDSTWFEPKDLVRKYLVHSNYKKPDLEAIIEEQKKQIEQLKKQIK